MFKFKFKGKTIQFTIYDTITFTSVTSTCWDKVKTSGVYTDEDIRLIGNLPLATLFQMCIKK